MDLTEMIERDRAFELRDWIGRKVSLRLGYYLDGDEWVAGTVRAVPKMYGTSHYVLVLDGVLGEVQVIPVERIHEVEVRTW